MNDINYHKATVKDIPLLVDLRIQFIEEYTGKQEQKNVDALRKQLLHYFNNAIESKTCISYHAYYHIKPVATGLFVIREQPGHFKNPSGRSAYIMNMYTLPDFRKKGIGTAILNELIDEASQLGLNMIELHATAEGEPVYIKGGFIKHHEPTYRVYLSEKKSSDQYEK